MNTSTEPEKRSPVFICGPHLYEFDGWTFEIHSYCGPWPLKKDLELRERAGRKFWKMWKKFDKLSAEEKEKCHLGGGCMVI